MAMTTLAGWQNFYVIVGSSAGALIGLQFVVLSLMSDKADARRERLCYPHHPALRSGPRALRHPLRSVGHARGAQCTLGLVGTAGVVYTLIVMRRMRSESRYRPQFEDWLFHVVLPCAAYLVLAYRRPWPVSIRTRRRSHRSVDPDAALLRIHNAWDAVTYHMFVRSREHGPPK